MFKRRFVPLLAVFFASVLLARGDLVMEQAISDTNGVSRVTIKLHAGKMRMDERDPDGYFFSAIVDLNTRDSLTLFPIGKTFLKRSGAEARKQMEASIAASHGTNQLDKTPVPPSDTDQSAEVNGYDTKIYQWSGANGCTEILWVATNFPDYAAIRTNLAQIDQFNAAGSHRNAQPVASLLPGMIVRTVRQAGGFAATNNLVSAVAEPVDASLFELPAGYSPWEPPKVMVTNAIPSPRK